jgi:hypothetical protein
MTISYPFSSTAFIPPGAISLVLIARMNLSFKAHVLWRELGKAIRVRDILVDEEAAPAAFDGVEVFPVEGNTGANDLHVARAVVAYGLAGAEWDAVLGLQRDLLFEQKILQLHVRREFKAQRPDNLVEKILKRLFPCFGVHAALHDFSAFAALRMGMF